MWDLIFFPSTFTPPRDSIQEATLSSSETELQAKFVKEIVKLNEQSPQLKPVLVSSDTVSSDVELIVYVYF